MKFKFFHVLCCMIVQSVQRSTSGAFIILCHFFFSEVEVSLRKFTWSARLVCKLQRSLVSASQVLGIQTCAIMPKFLMQILEIEVKSSCFCAKHFTNYLSSPRISFFFALKRWVFNAWLRVSSPSLLPKSFSLLFYYHRIV